MRAVTFDSTGEADVLQWGAAELSIPTATDVVVDVAAAGVNNADLLQRRGNYRVPTGASAILGLECSGVLSWVGEGVVGWSVGDEVCALLTGGGYAEQVVVPAAQLLPVPGVVGVVAAAALPEAACTVYSNIGMAASLRAGQTLLVQGGGSGIGTFAIQWAKAIGARVLVTAGSTRKLDRCAELGADVLINYRTSDFVEETLGATEQLGADVILDLVGATYLERNLRSLAPDGQLVIIGSQGRVAEAPLNVGLLMAKRATVRATTLRARPPEQKAAIVAAVRDSVWPLIERGAVEPVIDSILSMSSAAEAHRLIEAGQTVGKVLLEVPVH